MKYSETVHFHAGQVARGFLHGSVADNNYWLPKDSTQRVSAKNQVAPLSTDN